MGNVTLTGGKMIIEYLGYVISIVFIGDVLHNMTIRKDGCNITEDIHPNALGSILYYPNHRVCKSVLKSIKIHKDKQTRIEYACGRPFEVEVDA
jgi:hypothetical protein